MITSSLPSEVLKHQNITLFHTPYWREIWAKTLKCKSYYIFQGSLDQYACVPVYYYEQGIFTPKKLITHEEPLYTNINCLKQAINEVIQLANKLNCKYVKIKIKSFESSKNLPLTPRDVAPLKIKIAPNLNSVIPLSTNIEENWKRLDKGSARWAVKKAERMNVRIKYCESKDDVVEFYKIVSETRHRLGLPMFPFRLFELIRQRLIPNNASLLLADYNGKIIAGVILFFYKDRAVFGFEGYRKDYSHLQPVHYLLWKCIEDATKRRMRVLDLGETPRFHEGLLRFKRHFGALHYPIYMLVYGDSHERPFFKSLGRRIWRMLPLILHERLSPLVVSRVVA